MSIAYESAALESPGPGGSLKWVEHMSGHWTAQGLGGKYDIYPRGASGYTAYWSQAGTGSTHEIGSYDTLGAAFGAARRHADGERRQTAAEEGGEVAKDVARKAAASAYGAGQIESVTGSGNRYTVTLKSGKRLHVSVDGSTGTVTDPDDNHVVATHTVSEDHSDYAKAVRAGRQLALHQMKSESGYRMPRAEVIAHFERQGLSRGHAEAAADSYGDTWHRVLSAAEAEECDQCAHKHPKSVPTTPCTTDNVTVVGVHDRTWYVFVNGNPVVKQRDGFSWEGRRSFVKESKAYNFGSKAKAEKMANQARKAIRFDASETVPVIHEANDAGPFATVNRDTEELAKGHKLGEVHTPEDVYKLVHDVLSKESQEVFLVLPMDIHSQLLSRPVEIARGQRDRVSIGISDVMRPVIATNASRFVVVHNHPSGRARPSPKDKELTDTIRKHTLPDVVFCDHVVIGLGCFYSFTENKLYKVR